MKGNIKLMKKLFNILLVLLLSIGVFTSNSIKVFAEESGTCDNVDWRITDSGELIIGREGTTQEFANISSRYRTDYPWHSKRDSINSIKFIGTVKGKGSMAQMFYQSQATSIDLSNFNTSNVTDMSAMFYLSQATSLDLSAFDTSNVTNMGSMFAESQATSIAFPDNFGSAATDMRYMFSGSQVTSLDLSSFDTSNVTNMSAMFKGSQATSLDLSFFDTSKVTYMSYMFQESQATSLDLSNFNTSKVTNMKEMFRESQVTSLNLSSFDTSSVSTMDNMFYLSQTTSIIFSENMLGDNGERFKTSGLWDSDWVKVRDKNGNLTYDDTQFTGERIRSLTESTTPKLSGTWVRKSSPEYQAEIDKGQEYISKQGANVNNEWVKNGNTWTYTFDVFDDSIPYYIWEDRIPGYTSSVMKPDKTLMNQNGEKYYEIINRSTTLGSLNITKTTDVETEDRFEFTITLEGNGLEGMKVFSNIIFTDGVGKIKLGKDESKLIEGLPAGVTYTVEETPYSDYITTSTGETGTIVANETQEVSFHNEKVPVKNLTAESGFKVKKVVEGNNKVAETFDFIAQINAGEPNKLINLSNGESITTDASGLAIYEFSLANNEELIFSNLSTGASYQVTEKAGEYISSYSIQDLNEGNSINQSANENTTQNQALTTAVETLDADEEIEITFTNRIVKKQNLKVAKQVNGNAEDKAKQYEITVELYGLDPMATLDSDAGRFVADEDGYAIKTILLRDGEEFMIPEVPVGTQYVITESPSNTYAAYEITDANGGSNFVKSTNSNSDINLRLATQMETVNENEEATVKFTNTSQVTLKLEKVVDGNMGNKEDEFEFNVKVWKEKTTYEVYNYTKFIADPTFNASIELQNLYDSSYTCANNGNINIVNWDEFKSIDNNNKPINFVGPLKVINRGQSIRFSDVADGHENPVFIAAVSENGYWWLFALESNTGNSYLDLSKYGGVSNRDGSYKFTLKHGENLEIAKAFPGYSYEITEVDYSGEGYRTYPNDSMIQGRTISGVLNEDTDVKMRNIRGGAVPTEIRFYIPIGIPVIIGLGLIFVLKRRKNNKNIENI